MKFIIHSLPMLERAIQLEKDLHEKCYIPGRDTDQKQPGEDILRDNLKALKESEEIVYCLWDGDSFGTLFDMGSAYALDKVIIPYELGKDKQWKRFFKHKMVNLEKIQFKENKNEKKYRKE
jgi:nucleoside 2-deoxyribosyltransferase